MKIKAVNYHRNGSTGEGFYVGIVTNPFDAADTADEDFLVITVDDDSEIDRSEFTFVLRMEDLVDGDLVTAWRGDRAAAVCRRPMIDEFYRYVSAKGRLNPEML